MNMKKITKALLLVGMIVFLVYAGTCVVGNIVGNDKQPSIKIPDVKDAQYEVVIVNTGRVIFSNDVTRAGSFVVLNKYWDFSGMDFKYRDSILRLDEIIYGTITVNYRR